MLLGVKKRMTKNLSRVPAFGLILILAACSTTNHSGSNHAGSGRPGSNSDFHPPLKPQPEISTPVTSDTGASGSAEKKLPPVSVGVWIDAAGVEAFSALGFLQGLEKSEKIKVSKVAGTGLGCWIAVSWALENSNNRAEWQATKLSSWEAMGRGGSLLTRISGGRADYSKFKSEMSRLLTIPEFNSLARDADCPLLNARTGVLETARPLGIYRALWAQMATPLIGLEEELETTNQFSGVLGVRPRPRELDDYSHLDKSRSDVQAWVVLSLDSMRILSDEREPLRDALMRRFVDMTQGASVSPEGRPIYVSVPAFDLTVKSARDFTQRRNFLLQGRKHAERFLTLPWVDRIHQSESGLETDSPR
jgi:hypothetical protein